MSDKENKRKCFKCGSSPAEDGIKLFRALKPGTNNLVRCEQWAQYMYPGRNVNSVEFLKKLYNEHRMLCSKRGFYGSDSKIFIKDCSPQRRKLLLFYFVF
uniref:Uncharacterized protein n=1 Tax=Pectinophora gossypiella TaxID=13191 RepID=A0A1E1W8N2_PECGO